MEFTYNEKTYRVAYIEYHNKMPFTAIATLVEDSGYCTSFDFEFVYGDKQDIRYKWSGSGGKILTEIQAPRYGKGVKNVAYWISPDAKLKGKPKNIIRINEPYKIKTAYRISPNPFEVADHTHDLLYCEECEHWMVEECSHHQYWDDEGGVLKYKHDNIEVN